MHATADGSYFKSNDGLNIFYRYLGDLGEPGNATPVLCLPALTRNSRDFDDLAARLAGKRRVISMDFRGRGFSDYDKNWRNYHPKTYVADIWTLLDLLRIDRVIVFGTSLGGLCAMTMAEQNIERIAAVLMNDIGPDINPAGIARIREYTGRAEPVSSWEEAVNQTRSIYGDWLPDLDDAGFERLARCAYREIDSDVPRLDVDANIGRAVRSIGAYDGDAWEHFAAFGSIPVTLLWGVLSDVLTHDIVENMQAVKADLQVVRVENRGHVPLLDEPPCLAAIDALLEQVA